MVVPQFVHSKTRSYDSMISHFEWYLLDAERADINRIQDIKGESLGDGCYGDVYAHSKNPNWVIKKMNLKDNLRTIAFLKRCQHMNHPNLPKVHEFLYVKRDAGITVFVIMDRLYQQGDKRELISLQTRMDWKDYVLGNHMDEFDRKDLERDLVKLRAKFGEAIDVVEDMVRLRLCINHIGTHIDLHSNNIMIDCEGNAIINDPVIE